MRNSDPDAAVYWLARMLEAGEDPLYVARRLVRFASEDIGMADSSAFLWQWLLISLPFSGNAGVQCPFKSCGHLPVHRAQEQFFLYGL